jgi:hypothetical protein
MDQKTIAQSVEELISCKKRIEKVIGRLVWEIAENFEAPTACAIETERCDFADQHIEAILNEFNKADDGVFCLLSDHKEYSITMYHEYDDALCLLIDYKGLPSTNKPSSSEWSGLVEKFKQQMILELQNSKQ